MKNEEHLEQVALVRWFDLTFKRLKGRLAAVPNASMCPAYVGKKMNNEGRRKGYPDLQLLYPSNGYHGLIIEMKRKSGGVVSAEQKEWLEWLKNQGYQAVVCRGSTEAKMVINDYLGVK